MFSIKYGYIEDAFAKPDYELFPVILVAEDFTYASGDIGYFTDGMRGVCFDAIEVDPLPCKVPLRITR